MAVPCEMCTVSSMSVHAQCQIIAPADARDHTRGHDDDVHGDTRPRGELHQRLCALARTDAGHLAAQVCVHPEFGGIHLVSGWAGAAVRQLLLPAWPHGCILAAALRDACISCQTLAAVGAGARVVVGLHVCGGGQDAEQEGAL